VPGVMVRDTKMPPRRPEVEGGESAGRDRVREELRSVAEGISTSVIVLVGSGGGGRGTQRDTKSTPPPTNGGSHAVPA